MVAMRWALAAGLALLPLESMAQPSASEALGLVEDKDDSAVKPISLSKIGEEADATKVRLEEIRGRISTEPALEHVDEELAEIAVRIKELDRETEAGDLAKLPERTLSDLIFAWDQIGRPIERLQARLGDESNRFESELRRVRSMLGRWQATQDEEGITPTARAQASEAARELLQVERRIHAQINEIHDVQSRVSEHSQVVSGRLSELTVARKAQRGQILARTTPLWRVSPWTSSPLMGVERRFFDRQVEQIRMFATDELGSLVALLLGWLATWWMLVTLNRLPRGDSPDESLGLAASLKRPRSASFVLTVSIFVLVGPPVPWLLRQAMWLVVLPGLIRLLTPTPYRSITVVFAGPLLLSLISELVPESTSLARYAHLITSVSGLLAALWVGRWRRNETLEGLALKGLRLVELLLAVSIAANIVGYAGLPPVINHATMFSIYAAALLVGCVGVLRALIRTSVHTELLRRSRAIHDYGDAIADTLIRYVVLASWVLWVVVAIDAIGLEEPLWARFELWLEDPWEVGALSVVPNDLIAFGLTLYGTLLVSRLLGFVLDEDVLPRLDLAQGLPSTLSMLVRYGVLAIGFFMATAAAGVELGKLSLLVGAFGVGIGFGLQNVVNNFVSGLILMFERPVKVGDTVEFESTLGEVTRIGLRASRIRTLQGAEVIVPNSSLTSNDVINWTLSDRRRRFEIEVGVAYGTDPERVIALLEKVSGDNERLLSHPKPQVWFSGFGDSSLDFQLLVWTDHFTDWRAVRSELRVAINRAIVDAGIQIPFPQRDLHLRSVDEGLLGRVRGAGAGAGPESRTGPELEPESKPEPRVPSDEA